MSDQDEKKEPREILEPRKILVIGGGSKIPSALLAKITAEVLEKGFEVCSPQEAQKKGLSVTSEDARSADRILDSIPDPMEIKHEMPRWPKPVEDWRIKKGRYKGHFPRYR